MFLFFVDLFVDVDASPRGALRTVLLVFVIGGKTHVQYQNNYQERSSKLDFKGRSLDHQTEPFSYFNTYCDIIQRTFAGCSLASFYKTGFFSKEKQDQKFIQELIAVQTLLSFFWAVSRTSVRILYPARMDFSRSEQQEVLTGSLTAISANDSLLCMVFRMDWKYFSCYRQDFLISLNCSSLGSQSLNAASSNRYRQFCDFLSIFRAILRLVNWNLMMKQMKIQSLFLEMLYSFRIFQNYLVSQLAIEVMVFRQSTNCFIPATFGENTRDSQISLHDARSLSSQMRLRLINLLTVGSVDASNSMNFFSVRFWMLMRVRCGFESTKGWQPYSRQQAMQPAAQTSHLNEYFQFLSCSGETQMKVPLSSEKLSTLDMSISPTSFAQPKSPILITFPFPRRMFSGFRSRWITPLTVIRMKAWKIWRKTSSISVGFIFFTELKQRMRSPDSQYSITICSSSLSSSRQQSQTRMRLGCVNFFMSSISSSAWSISKGSTCIFLRANRSPVQFSARQTLPKLPSPMSSITLQDCIDCKKYYYLTLQVNNQRD